MRGTRGLQVRVCVFLLRKNGCGDFLVAAPFVFSANQLNITDTIGQGDSVRTRNNRPLLCLALP